MQELKFVKRTLQYALNSPFEAFASLGKMTNIRGDRHIYIDRGSTILGVAHLDSVCRPNHLWWNNRWLASPTIDNRLGAWMMLYGLPAMGLTFDVLLTENEERGASTASDFTPGKEYKWAFSFDRTGEDVVCYHYREYDFVKALESVGFKVGWGSYSDISSLKIGARAFNIGCGMYDYHSYNAYADLDVLHRQALRFVEFHQTYCDTRFAYEGRGRWAGGYGEYEDYGGASTSYYHAANSYSRAHSRRGSYPTQSEWDFPEDYRVVRGATAMGAKRTRFNYDNEREYYDTWWSANARDESEVEEVFLQTGRLLTKCDGCDAWFEEDAMYSKTAFDADLCRRCLYIVNNDIEMGVDLATKEKQDESVS